MATDVRPMDVLVRPVAMDAHFQLAATGRTKANYTQGVTNSLILDAYTRKGVLSGSIAQITDDYEVNAADSTVIPFGLFTDHAVPDSWQNDHEAAAGGLSVAHGHGLFIVYVFETHDAQNQQILAGYIPGMYLYCSMNGLLTPELPTTLSSSGLDIPVAIVTKQPTTADLSLGIALLI